MLVLEINQVARNALNKKRGRAKNAAPEELPRSPLDATIDLRQTDHASVGEDSPRPPPPAPRPAYAAVVAARLGGAAVPRALRELTPAMRHGQRASGLPALPDSQYVTRDLRDRGRVVCVCVRHASDVVAVWSLCLPVLELRAAPRCLDSRCR